MALALVALLISVVVFGYGSQASGPQADAPYIVGTPIPIGGHDGGSGPEGVGVDPTTNRIFVANTNDNRIWVVNGDDNTVNTSMSDARIGGPLGVAVDSAARRVYVTQRDLNTLLVVNPDTLAIVKSIDLSGKVPGLQVELPQSVVVWPSEHRAYVAMWGYYPNYEPIGFIYIIDTVTDSVIGTVSCPDRHAYWLALDESRGLLYLTFYQTGGGTYIAAMNTSTYAISTVMNADAGNYVLGNPAGIAVRPANGTVYVAQESGSPDTGAHLAIFSYSSGVYGKAKGYPGLELPLGRPVGVVYNPVTDRVFVTAYHRDAVVYVNAATNGVEGTLGLPTSDTPPATGPHIGMAVNPLTSRVYVANRLAGTLSVIQDGAAVPTPTPTNTPTPTPLPCTADAYEPDNTSAQARVIIPTFGYTQSHSFCGTAAPWETDEDWVTFAVNAPVTLTMTTSNLTGGADTMLTLYGPNVVTTTYLARDDDSGGGLASQIVYEFTQSGLYFLRVNNVGLAVTAAKLRATGTSPAASSLPQRNYDLVVLGGPPLSNHVFLPLVIRN